MRIRVLGYNVTRQKKNAYLHVSLEIEFPEGSRTTSCKINISEIGYFFGRVPNFATSFLLMSSVVYAIDRSVYREKYSVDGWSREFEVDFALPTADIFMANKEHIDGLLSYLTGDYWNCNFTSYVLNQLPRWRESHYFDDVKQVNLFSGGMDSLIGAIDSMERMIEGTVFLASHYDDTMGGPKTDQKRLLHRFVSAYNGRYKKFSTPVLIAPEVSSDTTCRSRSLLFIAIALQVAAYWTVDIVVPENGSVSLNYPLSPSRRASCSTRTTHPVVIAKLKKLLENVGMHINIVNPYEFMTKGEMVQACANRPFLLDVLPVSNSCGKRARKQFFLEDHSATHCGHCMPCMYRKAALVGYVDRSTYGVSIPRLYAERMHKISDDFYAMLNFLKRDLTDAEIARELRIAGMGGMDHFDDYVQLVKRTRVELKRLINAEGSSDTKRYIGLC